MNNSIIRLDLTMMKETISQAIAVRHENVEGMVRDSLDRLLSEDNLQKEIDKCVHEAIIEHVKSAATSYTVQRAVFELFENMMNKGEQQ